MRRRLMACVFSSFLACESGYGARPSGHDAGPTPPPSEVNESPTPVAHSTSMPERGATTTLGPAPAGMIAIPSGTLLVGTLPGTPGRNARYEADAVPLRLGSFAIDRLPYPADRPSAPRTPATHAEAAALCASEGKRLCTELEWERACKGDTLRSFASGDTIDVARCAEEPAACASPFGVLGMGTTAEWTASPPRRGLGDPSRHAIVRGQTTLADDTIDRRCAARRAVSLDAKSTQLGFRCCSGEVSSLAYPEEPSRPRVEQMVVDVGRLRAAMRENPALASYADDFVPFRATDTDEALKKVRRSRTTLFGWVPVEQVVRFSPVAGEEIWVVAGRALGSSLLFALYPLPDGRVVPAASLVLWDDPSPILVAHHEEVSNELKWATCWACDGENGALSYRADGTVFLSQD